jgi:aspartate/tyrosine/aromatic aminotransferase
MSHFSYLSLAPADPIFGLMADFIADPRPNKVNLGIGIYKAENLQTPLLSCVEIAEKELASQKEPKSYLPVEGDPLFLERVARLIFGEALYAKQLNHITSMQTVGGSSALHLAGELLAKRADKKIYIPNVSWPNHLGIFSQCGLIVEHYPYYDAANKKIDLSSLLSFLSTLPKQSAILLHVSCHNPSGADPSSTQWEEIAKACKQNNLIPVLDAAYLGFDQTVEQDAFAIRHFIEQEIELFCAISFSKNLSLYAERVGAFFAFSEQDCAIKITSECKLLIRRNYSNPPKHGATIVKHILGNPFLKQLWEEELLQMKQRICEMRNNFTATLTLAGAKKNYSYLLDKKGLFSFCDLSPYQVKTLISEYGIYLTLDGRINLTGLTEETMPYVANAIIKVGG